MHARLYAPVVDKDESKDRVCSEGADFGRDFVLPASLEFVTHVSFCFFGDVCHSRLFVKL